jgi:hypothetical protein
MPLARSVPAPERFGIAGVNDFASARAFSFRKRSAAPLTYEEKVYA